MHSPGLLKMESDGASTVGPVEMVTVPALGPEWKASEMRNMTKRGKREDNAERRAQKWKEWRRGERGLCGRYFTRKFLAFFLFFFCGAYVHLPCFTYTFQLKSPRLRLILVLVFTIPRFPGFQFNQDKLLAAASHDFNKTVPTQFLRAPANFSFPASADLAVDTGSNFLPLHFNSLHATVFDLVTLRQVATGDLGSMTLKAKTVTPISVPLNFSYVATNDSDATCAYVSLILGLWY